MNAFVADVLLAEAAEQLPDAVYLRRRIHRHPELGLELPRTQATVVDALNALDLDVHTGDGRVRVDLPAVVQGSVRHSEFRGKLNGGGSPLVVRTNDGTIRVERL